MTGEWEGCGKLQSIIPLEERCIPMKRQLSFTRVVEIDKTSNSSAGETRVQVLIVNGTVQIQKKRDA